MRINVGFLVSYDYEMLKISIPLVYKSADKIVLAVDSNLLTWSGTPFVIDKLFFNWLEEFDKERKIEIYEDNFYIPTNSAIENETRERNMLAKKMGEGYCIQFDADEFCLDFDNLVKFIKKKEKTFNGKKSIQICPYLINVYKKVEGGYLFIKDITPFYLGTNHPNYVRARKNKNQKKRYIPFLVVHQTWGREEDEIEFKIKNWGHNKDFDVESYFEFWKSINKNNYRDFKQFHPFDKTAWNELIFVAGNSIDEIIVNGEFPHHVLNMRQLKLKNLGQNIKYLFK